MNREERIRELIRKSDATTNPETDKRILGDAVEHLAELRQEESAATQPNIWRRIMINTTTKSTAAAAIIIVALFLSISKIGLKETYAIEQTIEAMRNVTTAHCLGKTFGGQQIEMWIEVNPETGDNEKFYLNSPEVTIVATQDETYMYRKSENAISLLKGSHISSRVRFGRFVEDMAETTKSNSNAEFKINEIEGTKPLIVLTIETDEMTLECKVDPATKLPLSMNFRPKGMQQPGLIGQSVDEIYYNKPLPEGIFEFEIPEGSQVIEQ